MNKKTVTSSLALLLSVACVGAQTARAQDAADTTAPVSDSQPPADGQPPESEPAPDAEPPAESTESAPPSEPSSEPPADTSMYETSDSSEPPDYESSMEETDQPPPEEDKGFLKLRWGAQLGYLFPTDPRPDFRAPKWMPIGLELGLGLGKSPFALVIKADGSPLCFGGHDCSGTQVRGLVGLEVGIQKASGSVLHMVYFNASLGYRYATSKIENAAGSTLGGTLGTVNALISEVSASMMVPVTRTFSLGPRAALSSNLTGDPKDGVMSLQLGVRVLHAI